MKFKTLFGMVFGGMVLTGQVWAQDGQTSTALGPMVVTGSMVEQEVSSAPASINILTKEDLEKEAYKDVGEALRFSEGVMMTSGGQDRGISLRGYGAGYTLILVDGKRMDSRSLSVRHNADADLSWIPVSSIERIEVVRGPMSSLYGAEALGGVINIITKKDSNRWKGSLQTSYTAAEERDEGDEQRLGVSLTGPLVKDKLGLKLYGSAGERPRSKLPQTDTRSFNGKKDGGGGAELIYRPSKQHEISAEVSEDTDTRLSLNRGQEVESRTTRSSQGLAHKGTWSNVSTEVRAQFDDYDYVQSNQPSQLKRQTLSARANLPLFEGRHVLVTGIDSEKNHLENLANLSNGATSSTQNAFYLEDSAELTRKATLTFGGRATDHDKFGTNVSPRAYLVWKENQRLTFKTGVGTGYKPPTLLQMDESFNLPSCRGACLMIGNPDLRPETNVSTEAGFKFQEERWNVGATVFESRLSNMINTYFATIDGQRYRLLQNVADARTRGIETSAAYALTHSLELKLNWTVTEARNLTEDTVLTSIPSNVANLGIDYRTTDRLSLYVNTTYTGSQVIDSNGTRLDISPYTLFNVGSSYRLPSAWIQHAKLGLGIQNLGNTILDEEAGYGEAGRRYFVRLQMDYP